MDKEILKGSIDILLLPSLNSTIRTDMKLFKS